MTTLLFSHFAKYKNFWKLRAYLYHLNFLWTKFLYYARIRGEREVSDSATFRKIFASIWVEFVFALSVAIGFQISNPFLNDLYHLLGWQIPDEGIYGTLLGAVSSVGAVFIGLYYAALTAVGSSVYARLPSGVRILLISESWGTVYLRFLAFLTFFTLALLCLRVLGYGKVYLAIPFTGLLAGIGILGFVRLGRRAFYLFDPVTVSDSIFKELKKLTLQVTEGGFRWKDRDFQNHAHKQANKLLDAIDTLHEVCAKEEHLSVESRMQLLRQLTSYLCFYEDVKTKIPTESYWYGRSQEHPTWYLCNDVATDVAYRTGTTIQPTETINSKWIEEALIKHFHIALKDFLNKNRFDATNEVLEIVVFYVVALCKVYEVEQAVRLIQDIGNAVIVKLTELSSQETKEDVNFIGIVESLSTMPTQICLTYARSAKDLLQICSSLRVDGSFHHPIEVLQRKEWITSNLEAEWAIELKQISPEWYIKELLSIIGAKVHSKCVQKLFLDSLELYDSWVSSAKGQSWIVGLIISREFEFLSKLENAEDAFEECWVKLNESKNIPGLIWPALDTQSLFEMRADKANQIISQNQNEIINLQKLKRPKNFPDLFGQFMHTSGELCFDALLNNKPSAFVSLFPFYFQGCFLLFANLLSDEHTSTEISMRTIQRAAGPILDLMELSGYSKLFAQFHENSEFWRITNECWANYLDSDVNNPPIKLINLILAANDQPLTMAMRSEYRMRWNMRVNQLLQTIERKTVYSKGSFLHSYEQVIHADPLIRVFADSDFGHGLYDGMDIFILECLIPRSDFSSIENGKHRHLEESIDNEIKNYQDYLNDTV